MFIKRKFPNTRLRRLRKNSNLIDLVAETKLSSNDLIQPIFIKENYDGKEDIKSMPGIFRYGLGDALKEIEDIINSGVNSIAVFPVIEASKKNSKGTEAINKDNFIFWDLIFLSEIICIFFIISGALGQTRTGTP